MPMYSNGVGANPHMTSPTVGGWHVCGMFGRWHIRGGAEGREIVAVRARVGSYR